jgi:beta-phosphoglucomutase-like phosphatase (HAD superfamily)
MSVIKALIFDLDGVLADLCDLHRLTFIKAFNAAVGTSLLDDDIHERHLEGLDTRSKLSVCKSLFPTYSFDSDAVFKEKQAKTADELALYHFPTRTADALTWAKEQGLILACVTNSIRATMDTVLMRLGIANGIFDLTLSNEDVSAPKPSPAGYIAAMERLGVSPLQTVIFEDSARGLAAANASGAHVVKVLNSLDITASFLESVILTGSRPVAATSLRIVIPMAGLGSRFAKDGFYVQKPFLPVIGENGAQEQMWEMVVENLMPKDPILRANTEVHLVVREEQLPFFRRLPHVHLHTVPYLTEGAACTVLTLKDLINDDVPLCIGNSDQFLDWDADEFYRAAFHVSYSGAISVFYNPRPDDLKWSYAALTNDGRVSRVAEKVYIGPHATTGIYAWKRGRDFVKHAENMIARNERVNNEFYVCPVYNGAIQEGSDFRIHNCTRFWGVGVPDDYIHFLDHYKPRDKTYTFHTALSRKYEAMRCKWSARLPVPQPQVVEDPALCAAMWTLGSFHLNSSFRQLIRGLQPWASKLAFFNAKEECDKESKSASPMLLHHTFFQFQTFPLDEAQRSELTKPLSTWAEVAQAELSKLPPYYLNIEGACVTRSGIVVLGFPPTDYTSVRNALRNAGPVKEPHQQDVHHITIARWTRSISGEEMAAVTRVLECFRGVRLGMLQPETWSVGFATWSMREETLRPVYSWQAPPAPWVLHRGNMSGLNKVTENDPLILKKALESGWDCEIDIWLNEGEKKGVWLGHDSPEHYLDDTSCDALLSHSGAWIHCKNLAAFNWLRERSDTSRFHFFSHDLDPLALTSRGIAWIYPGVEFSGRGTVTVVKADCKSLPKNVKGVCVDWLPGHYKEEK